MHFVKLQCFLQHLRTKFYSILIILVIIKTYTLRFIVEHKSDRVCDCVILVKELQSLDFG